MRRTIFITGTDTGVGKTLLTALLLSHLRQTGHHALAMKPFCAGSRSDVHLLHALQDGELTLEQINPFFFPDPVAPLVAARKHRRRIQLNEVLQHIHRIASRPLVAPKRSNGEPPIADLPLPITNRQFERRTQNSKLKTRGYLLIEGAGGLLAPLGEDFTALDLIARLKCEVIIVSRNQLGTINHTLLTVRALLAPHAPRAALHPPPPKLVLMNPRRTDPSSSSNPRVLSEFLTPARLFRVAFLGPKACNVNVVRANSKRLKKSLSQILS